MNRTTNLCPRGLDEGLRRVQTISIVFHLYCISIKAADLIVYPRYCLALLNLGWHAIQQNKNTILKEMDLTIFQ